MSFAIDGSGSVFAFWFYDKNLSIEEAPIVFLGSEGSNTLFAKSFDEFLGLLAYDVDCVLGINDHIISHAENPARSYVPKEKYTNEYFEGQLKELEGRFEEHDMYEGYNEFRTWLKHSAKIEVPTNPY